MTLRSLPANLQVTSGSGVPLASQGNSASVPSGRVWLMDPMAMMGGGMSETPGGDGRKRSYSINCDEPLYESTAFHLSKFQN